MSDETTTPTPPTLPTTADRLEELRRRRREDIDAPAATAEAKQGARGKGSARGRIEALLDEGSFSEIDAFARHRSRAFGLEKRRPAGTAS